MIAEIEAAKKDGDTLGGVVEVVVHGLPPGLGLVHAAATDRLDSQLAGAVMGIQAIKGVEIGDGFETARTPRQRRPRRDRIPGPTASMRSTNRAGGTRGRHDQRRAAAGARRDEADLHRAAGAGHRRHGHRRRGRRASTSAPTCARCPPPAWSSRPWSRWCWRAPRWRSSAGTRWPRRGPTSTPTCARWPSREPAPRAVGTGVGLMAPKAVLVGMPGSGKSTIGRRLAKALEAAAAGYRRQDRRDHRPQHCRPVRRRRAGVPPHRGGMWCAPPWPSTTASCRSAAARSPRPACAKRSPGTP